MPKKKMTKINSKQDKDLNIRPETIQFPEENTGKKAVLAMIWLFLDMTPKAQETIPKINKWDCMYIAKETTKKRWPQSRRKGLQAMYPISSSLVK